MLASCSRRRTGRPGALDVAHEFEEIEKNVTQQVKQDQEDDA